MQVCGAFCSGYWALKPFGSRIASVLRTSATAYAVFMILVYRLQKMLSHFPSLSNRLSFESLVCATHIRQICFADLVPYIIGSMLKAGCPFSVRNASNVSGSVAIVSSPTISQKLSIPYSSFAVLFRRSLT